MVEEDGYIVLKGEAVDRDGYSDMKEHEAGQTSMAGSEVTNTHGSQEKKS